MIGEPYSKKPHPGGLPTQYQDTPAKLFEDNSMGGYGGDKFPLPGGLPGAVPQAPPEPQPYGGMAGLDQMLQQRKASDDHRQMLVQLLAGRQQQPQGPAPHANQSSGVYVPTPVVETSPWTILTAGINGLADGMKKGRQPQDPNAGGGIVSGFGGGAGAGAGGGSFGGGGAWQ